MSAGSTGPTRSSACFRQRRSHEIRAARAGPPGFEPGLTDPESVGLPLPHGPVGDQGRCYRLQGRYGTTCTAGYGGGVLVTGPTWTRSGSRHPEEATSAGTRLSGSVTLTRSNCWHMPPGPETSLQSLTKYIGCPESTTIDVGG